MAGAFEFTWKSPPSVLGSALHRRASVVPDAVFAVGQSGASRMESYAKENRPWNDQTNAARSGLTGTAEREGNNTVIQLYGTAPHQIFLDLGTVNMAPLPIIWPTIQSQAPMIFEDAATVVRRIMAGG
jgi:hypothetical protein